MIRIRSITIRLAFTALITAAGVATSFGQIDDFNTGSDSGWTRYDIFEAFGPHAEFTFPNGNSYRIKALVSPAPAYAGARAFSMREDVTYTDFYAAVDIVDWDTQLDQAFGLVARGSTPGLGTLNGYVLNYDPLQSPASGQLQINRVDGEAPTTIAILDIDLDPAKDYRLVLKGEGATLTGYVFDLSSPGSPLGSLTADDATHPTGTCGIFVYDRSDVSVADATFDNYYAGITAPQNQAPTLSNLKLANGKIEFAFETKPNFSAQLQKALSLPAQAGDWTAVETFPATLGGGVQLISLPTAGDAGFYRVVTPAP